MAARDRHELVLAHARARLGDDGLYYVRERQPLHRVRRQLIAARVGHRLKRREFHVAVPQGRVDHPPDVAVVHALRDRHRQLHAHAQSAEVLDHLLAQADRVGVTQRMIGLHVSAVELEEDHQLVLKRCQFFGRVASREQDAVGRQVNPLHALQRVEERKHLIKFRVKHRLPTGELHRIEPALLFDKKSHVALEQIQRHFAIALGVAIADRAGEIAGVGHLDQDRAAFVGHLIGVIAWHCIVCGIARTATALAVAAATLE